jgi:uncharacterized LabA/DUF88 family protein
LAQDNKIARALSLKSRVPVVGLDRLRRAEQRSRDVGQSRRGACNGGNFQERHRFMSQANSSRIALFIDGANLHATAKALGFEMDYRRLLKEFQGRGNLLRAYYYTAVIEDQEFSSIRPLIDWLDYNGFTVVTKATKEYFDANGRRKIKGSMDIELAVDAMELAGRVDQIVLFSGDGDFRPLVEAVQRRGVRVTVVSTLSSQPPMIADDLRRQADVFTDLVDLQPRIGRDPAERASSRGV